jgi:hypothetical protein
MTTAVPEFRLMGRFSVASALVPVEQMQAEVRS